MKTLHTLVGTALTLACVSNASAGLTGFFDGRSADPSNMSKLSVELGLTDIDDLRVIGARGNYKIDDKITAFANIGQADLNGADGFAIGGGVFYFLDNQRITDYVDIALKPAIGYYSVSNDVFGTSVDSDQFSLSFEALVSSADPIPNTPLTWYGSAGLAYYTNDTDVKLGDVKNTDSDDDIDVLLSGGVVLPLGPGQLYAGVAVLPDFGLGGGYRFMF